MRIDLCLALLLLSCPLIGPQRAMAQTPVVNVSGDQHVSHTSTRPPATLRLVQVVPRPPLIHFYALAQDEREASVLLPAQGLSLQAGADVLPVAIGPNEGIAFVLLVDVSGSQRAEHFDAVKTSLLAWIASLKPVDRAAVVTFGETVRTIQAYTGDKSVLGSAIRGLVARDQQTRLNQGFVHAIDMSRLSPGLPTRRAIVVLTDGLDEARSGANREEVLDRLTEDPIPIYAVGTVVRPSPRGDDALKLLSGLTRASGGDFRRVSFAQLHQLDKACLELRHIISNTQHFGARCQKCLADRTPTTYRLLLSTEEANLSSHSVRATSRGNVLVNTRR